MNWQAALEAGHSPTVQPANGWAAALEAATREVFEVMLGIPLRAVSDAEPPLVADLTVMVGLSGQLRGVLSLHCTAESACLWVSRMLGVEHAEFSQHVRDGIGEIANMMVGSFKRKLPPGVDDNCMISTPTVISGSDYHLHALSGGEHVEVSMGFAGAPLWVTLDLRR
jgi:chemotaxis protein CheX